MVSQCRYALSRKSSIHCGSFFFAEMKRMTSSFSPGGAESASMSVTNPHLYSRFASVSISRVSVGMIDSQTATLETTLAFRLRLHEPSAADAREAASGRPVVSQFVPAWKLEPHPQVL